MPVKRRFFVSRLAILFADVSPLFVILKNSVAPLLHQADPAALGNRKKSRWNWAGFSPLSLFCVGWSTNNKNFKSKIFSSESIFSVFRKSFETKGSLGFFLVTTGRGIVQDVSETCCLLQNITFKVRQTLETCYFVPLASP
jgi:hypothetical protein